MPANFDEIIDRRNTSSIKYDFAAERGKRIYVRFAFLNFERGKIDGRTFYPRGRTRFESSHFKAERDKAVRKFRRGGKPRGSHILFPFASNDAAV